MYVYSPDNPLSSAPGVQQTVAYIYTPGTETNAAAVLSTVFSAARANRYNSAFVIPPDTRHRHWLVDRHSIERKVGPALVHFTSSGNRATELLILYLKAVSTWPIASESRLELKLLTILVSSIDILWWFGVENSLHVWFLVCYSDNVR